MMITRKVYPYCRRPLVIILCVGLALLASGCMWGMVRDATTGAPISGATVTYTDSTGTTASTTTDASGQYSFAEAYWPAPGPVNVRAEASGYKPLTIQVQYDGNPSGFGAVHNLAPTTETPLYHNATWGFSMEFPEDWMVVEGEEQEEGTAVMAMAPPEDGNDEYPDLCLVTAGELDPGMTLETFFQLMLTSMEEDPSGVQQLETGEANVNGRDAKWIVISLYDPDFNTDIKSLIYVMVKEPRGYMILCMSEAAQFSDDRSELEGIAESFRID